jgi:hypothetical protein
MTKVARRNRQARECRGDLRAVVFLARLDLLKLGDDHAASPGDMAGNRFALRFQAQPAGALGQGRESVIGGKKRGWPGAPRSRGAARRGILTPYHSEMSDCRIVTRMWG